MFKKIAILSLFLALSIPTGCSQNRQADLDDQIEARLSNQNIKDVDAKLKENGNVELTGNVNTPEERVRAEETARSVAGVNAVENLIKVKNTEPDNTGVNPAYTDRDRDLDTDKDVNKDHNKNNNETLGDPWLTFKTKLALYADPKVSGSDINVETKDGVVNLIGKVPTQESKQAALQAAHKIDGVKNVEDQLQVVPESQRKFVNDTDENIAKNVENILDKDPLTKDLDLDVVANNGVVSLTGEADNMGQVETAIQKLRTVKGVKAINADAVVIKNITSDVNKDKEHSANKTKKQG